MTVDNLLALWYAHDERYRRLRTARKPRLLSPAEVAAVRDYRISEALDATGPGGGDAFALARNWVQPGGEA